MINYESLLLYLFFILMISILLLNVNIYTNYGLLSCCICYFDKCLAFLCNLNDAFHTCKD